MKEIEDNKKLNVGEKLVCRFHDGLLTKGWLLKTDDKRKKALIKVKDGTEYWAYLKDVFKEPSKEVGQNIYCCLCYGEKSASENEIVLCDDCGAGYHQDCHVPFIEDKVKRPGVNWQCRRCILHSAAKAGGAPKKGSAAKQMLHVKKFLPYKVEKLSWDKNHRSNLEGIYCYCEGPGMWYRKMMQCNRCSQWFHEACVQSLERPLIMGDRFYVFVCSACNTGSEFMKRIPLKWEDLAQLALFNITMANNLKYYDFYDELMPWVNKNWEHIAPGKRLESVPKQERSPHVQAALMENQERFQNGREIKKRQSLWGLRLRLPPLPPLVEFTKPKPYLEDDANCYVIKSRKQKTNKTLDGSPVSGGQQSVKAKKKKVPTATLR